MAAEPKILAVRARVRQPLLARFRASLRLAVMGVSAVTASPPSPVALIAAVPRPINAVACRVLVSTLAHHYTAALFF